MKLKFSGAGIKEFFVNNGEKIVLAIMVLLLLSFLYGAITARPLDESKSPESIVRESEQAKTRINSVDFKDSGETVSAADFQKLIAEDRKEVPIAKLQETGEWNPRLFPELTKRGDPEIYPVGELQIAAGSAVVPFTKGDAGSHAATTGGGSKITPGTALPGVRAVNAETKPVYYTILTGIVPVEKEEQEYRRRFEYAVKPSAGAGGQVSQASTIDVPKYFFFQAERAELKDANDSNPNWTPIDFLTRVPDLADAGKQGDKWAVPYGEIVDAAYVFPPATAGNTTVKFYPTWPLPPVFLKYWGMEAGHPKVPLVSTQAATEQPAEQPAGTGTPEPSNPFGLPGGGAAAGGAAGSGQHKSTPPAAGQPKRGVAPGHSTTAGQTDTGAATTAGAYRLFRFIDTTAQSGKTYRYRVKLILANPNYGLKAEDLEKPENAASPWALSPWSEPSAAVTVPAEARILADGLAVRGADALGKIYILGILKDEKSGDWMEVAKDFDVALGGYASFKDVKIENATDMAAEELRTFTVPAINADQAMLLDVRNDEVLGATKSKGPTEMVFMDSSGQIKTCNSAVDGLVLKDYQQRTTVVPEAAAPAHNP